MEKAEEGERKRKQREQENKNRNIRLTRKIIEKHFEREGRAIIGPLDDGTSYVRTIVTQDNVINVSSNYIFTYILLTDLETITHGLSMWCLRCE